MNLGQAILLGEAKAYGQFSDLIRARGGTYCETVNRIHAIFEDAGRKTTDADIENKFLEADEIEARS
jgi:hypothetical protein